MSGVAPTRSTGGHSRLRSRPVGGRGWTNGKPQFVPQATPQLNDREIRRWVARP